MYIESVICIHTLILCMCIYCFPTKRMKNSTTESLLKKTGSINRVYVEEISLRHGMQIASVYKTSRSESMISLSVY